MTAARTFTGTEARQLMRRARIGTLATINREGGHPYASLANIATDSAGAPLLLISRLAWHTQNLLADPRASVMVAEPSEKGDALTGRRATFIGAMKQQDDAVLRGRYLARHPEAAFYAGFADFGLWRLEVEQVHAIAGFGRIETLPAAEVLPPADAIAGLAESAVAHMNADHTDAIEAIAVGLLGGAAGAWRFAAVDGDGADLVLGEQSLRLAFDTPVASAEALRSTLKDLTAQARRTG